MEVYVLPLMKSPNPEGRIGPERWQDWYRGCVRALTLARQGTGRLLVVSAFMEPGFDEAQYYKQTLHRLGGECLLVREGFDTIGQLAAARKQLGFGDNLIVVCSLPHWPRVWWLSRKDAAIRRQIVLGIPRPKEFLSDIVANVVFPIIDMLGMREQWQTRTRARRMLGKL